jgi:hypothetical protein
MRKDFLDVFKNYNVKNEILNDFKSHWLGIESDTINFQKTSFTEWHKAKAAWIGFFTEIRNAEAIGLKEGEIGNKNLFNQKSSPTLGPLFVQEKMGCKLFVRLCEDNVNFTIRVNDNNLDMVKKLRQKWLSALANVDIGNGKKITRAKRIGKTKVMVIGYVKEYVAVDNDKVDVAKTIANLKEIQHFMLKLEID